MNTKTATATAAAPATAKDKEKDVKREPRTAEQKAAKFRELAKARVSRIINGIRGLGNLSSSNYSSTPSQRAEIIAALKGAVADTEARFSAPATKEKPSFDFTS